MNYTHRLFLIALALIVSHYSSITIAEEKLASDNPSNTADCLAFETTLKNYSQSLSKDESGKPMASGQSIPLAWKLIGTAEDCLIERKVNFERISTHALKILPDTDKEPSKTASLLNDLTSGAVIYDVGFFLRKPYAAGGFEQNILFLPHSAVLGEVDMVTRHELTHARAHSLLLADDLRLRHLWIFDKDSMYVDEVLAYSEGGINSVNAERLKSWSLDMANDYIAQTRKLIKSENAQVATSMDGQRCPMSPNLKTEVNAMLSCIEGVLNAKDSKPADIARCDGPRADATLCVL